MISIDNLLFRAAITVSLDQINNYLLDMKSDSKTLIIHSLAKTTLQQLVVPFSTAAGATVCAFTGGLIGYAVTGGASEGLDGGGFLGAHIGATLGALYGFQASSDLAIKLFDRTSMHKTITKEQGRDLNKTALTEAVIVYSVIPSLFDSVIKSYIQLTNSFAAPAYRIY